MRQIKQMFYRWLGDSLDRIAWKLIAWGNELTWRGNNP
jgi:hypothetical protein